MANFLQRIIREKPITISHYKNEAVAEPSDFNASITARLAIYDSLASAPRVIDLKTEKANEFINHLATKIYQASQEKGGEMPFTVIKEIVENLIHARFKEVVVSVMDNGNTIRVSDQGPGISDKDRAFQPGFSTATAEMKDIIKGVGSGLPVAKEALSFMGGLISIDDNMGGGTVVTLTLSKNSNCSFPLVQDYCLENINQNSASFPLTNRQKKVLSLITETGAAGPSFIASELDVSLSTAHRDLMYLEKHGLIKSDRIGKRSLTSQGVRYLNKIFNH